MIARTKTKLAKTAVTSFGAALVSINVAPQLEAAVVDLFPAMTPKTVAYGNPNSSVFIDFSQITNAGHKDMSNLRMTNSAFGKTIYTFAGISGLIAKNLSDTVSVNQFIQFTEISYNYGKSETGTRFFGFITGDNKVGWVQLDLGGLGNPITFLGAAYEDAGNPIHVGTVPEPTAAALAGLAALALGATGVRRLRKRRSAKS